LKFEQISSSSLNDQITMGSSQSSPESTLRQSATSATKNKTNDNNSSTNNTTNKTVGAFPAPSGSEYDNIDRLAAELPHVIDEESRIQVEDYRQACNNGKGPMVRRIEKFEFGNTIMRYEK
jgi:hypothetical protein